MSHQSGYLVQATRHLATTSTTLEHKISGPTTMYGMSYDMAEDALEWVVENMEVELLFINDAPFEVAAPNFVELTITQSDPGVRGDTAQGATKPAVLETGAVVQVPLFVDEGQRVKVDTRTREYLGRA